MAEASLGPIDIEPPPSVVGGESRRVMEVAARCGDGWNSGSRDPELYGGEFAAMDEMCRHLGRERPLAKMAQVFVRMIDLHEARDLVKRMEDLGTDTLTFVLDDERGPDWVRRVADGVL